MHRTMLELAKAASWPLCHEFLCYTILEVPIQPLNAQYCELYIDRMFFTYAFIGYERLTCSGVDSFATALVQRFFSAVIERLLPPASPCLNVELADRTLKKGFFRDSTRYTCACVPAPERS